MTMTHTALLGIALGLGLARAASAQSQAPDAGDSGQCTPSRDAHECGERCPSFDTCFIDEGEGQLYYRVKNQRFDCDGLDCTAASVELGDYCCQRGEYAPSHHGGGGCAVSGAGPAPVGAGASAVLGLACAAAVLCGHRYRRRWAPPRGDNDGGSPPS